MSGIDRPADARISTSWARDAWARDEWALRCREESPAWGYEGEGEQCCRPREHDGPHYYEDPDVILQWVAKDA